MFKFSSKDKKVIASIFLFLLTVISLNLRVSLRRGRDNLRKNDAGAIQHALDSYLSKYKVFPESEDGRIVACFGDDTYYDEKKERYVNLVACKWGEDGFEDLDVLPKDPYYDRGRDYLYISNTKTYQFYISLEGESEAEYTESIVARNLNCGNAICNYGKAYGETPLNISLEEYEETKTK